MQIKHSRYDELSEKVTKGRKFSEMKETEGWKLLEHILAKQVDGAKQTLINAQNLQNPELVKIQMEGRAYQAILNLVDAHVRAGRKASEQLDKIIKMRSLKGV